MNRRLAKALFFAVEKVRGEPVFECFRELQRSQWFSRDQLINLQWQRLTSLLEHAYSDVPFYRSLFKKLGMKPADIRSPEDFRRIPVLTKECVRANVDQMLAQNGKERLHSANTSGSTGLPLEFYRDGRSTGYSLGAMFLGHSWYGLEIGSRGAMLWGVPLDWRMALSMRLKDLVLNRFRQKEYIYRDQNLRHFWKMMKAKGPEYLMGCPSMLYAYAFFLKEQDIDGKMFHLKMVKGTSEVFFDYQRQYVESVFGCKSVDEYGAAETGIIAFECPEGGLHIMADCVYVEFLDEFDQPTPPGTKGRIVVTNLRNHSMPMLRYDIGDIGLASEAVCQCGRGLPLMESLEGRVVDELIMPDGKRTHPDFFYAVMGHLTHVGLVIKQYKIYQVALDQLKIEIVKGPDFSDETLKYIDKTLHQFLGSGMDIRYEFVSDIARDRSGKLRYFVSLLNID